MLCMNIYSVIAFPARHCFAKKKCEMMGEGNCWKETHIMLSSGTPMVGNPTFSQRAVARLKIIASAEGSCFSEHINFPTESIENTLWILLRNNAQKSDADINIRSTPQKRKHLNKDVIDSISESDRSTSIKRQKRPGQSTSAQRLKPLIRNSSNVTNYMQNLQSFGKLNP